jgi:hypothetical protein
VAISQNTHLSVAGIYSPLTALADVVGTISEYLKPFLSSEYVVLGDYNSDWLTPASDHFKNICLDFNLTQLIAKPTRIHVKNPANFSLIDLILTNSPYKYLSSGVFANDHTVLLHVFEIPNRLTLILI